MFCRGQLVELQENYETITGLGAEVVAVSVDSLRGAARAIESLGLEFPILSDPEADTLKLYDIYIESTHLPHPSTFIVDKAGNIRWKYIGTNLTDRPDNDAIIAQLRELG